MSLAPQPACPSEVPAGALFAENRFDTTVELLATLDECPDRHLARRAGALIVRLLVPESNQTFDRAKQEGVYCLLGRMYDVNHPELFDGEPPVERWLRGDRYRASAYDDAVDKTSDLMCSLEFYLDSGMERWRRFRHSAPEGIGVGEEEQTSTLDVRVLVFYDG